MYFSELELFDFRNYHYLNIQFHDKVNIIIGENAQGKTNLLESLYLTSLGKSFRTMKDNDMIRFGAEMARIRASVRKKDRNMTVDIALVKNRKSIKIDGIRQNRTSDLLENIHLVVFSPDDLRIVKDGPQRRRRFMDQELCQLKPVYYDTMMKYRKVLMQRNALLKEDHPDEMMLDIWDQEMAECGSALILYRKEFLNKLDPVSRRIHSDLTHGKESLRLSYEADICPSTGKKETKQIFLEFLKKNRRKDLARRNSTGGPQRDDIRMEVDGIDVRSFGSQGQQRSAALSMKLAELFLIIEETGEKPVLLLDDVLSELDPLRQKQLLTSFQDLQIFITATEITDKITEQLPEHFIFHVSEGEVKRYQDEPF